MQGSHILNQLLAHASVSKVTSLVRRPSPHPIIDPSSKLTESIESTTDSWPSKLGSILPSPSPVLFSALGTTRADAGGIEAQRKIDYTLNFDLAKAAKDAGVKTYVLISSMGANAKAWAPYSAMKGQLEDDVIALGFDKTVIVQPGLIVGHRETSRFVERPLHSLANLLGSISPILKNAWAQDADAIAKAAVRAGIA